MARRLVRHGLSGDRWGAYAMGTRHTDIRSGWGASRSGGWAGDTSNQPPLRQRNGTVRSAVALPTRHGTDDHDEHHNGNDNLRREQSEDGSTNARGGGASAL